MKNISTIIRGVVAGLLVVASLSFVSAGTYVAPTVAPTGGNVEAPLNVGTSAQVKNGGLSVNAFAALQNSYFAQNVGIGDTTNDATLKLDVEGDLGATRYCDQNGSNCKTITDMVPTNAVMAFDLAVCPTGWTDYGAANGRYIVGVPSGGTLGGTAGTALSNLENRATGAHTHSEIIVHFPMGGYAPGIGVGASGKAGTTGTAGSVAGTNAPYLQLRYCKKSSSTTAPSTPTPAPTVTMSVSPAHVYSVWPSTSNVTVTWSTTNATSCTASYIHGWNSHTIDWDGAKSISGSQVIPIPGRESGHSYENWPLRLDCSGSGGTGFDVDTIENGTM